MRKILSLLLLLSSFAYGQDMRELYQEQFNQLNDQYEIQYEQKKELLSVHYDQRENDLTVHFNQRINNSNSSSSTSKLIKEREGQLEVLEKESIIAFKKLKIEFKRNLIELEKDFQIKLLSY